MSELSVGDRILVNNGQFKGEYLSDAAKAVYDGASSVKLSGEAAAGKYPVDVMFYHAAKHAEDILGLKSGDNIILTGGQASKQPGSTNTIRLETIR